MDIYVVYILTCNKCTIQYVWQAIEQFQSRWSISKSDSRKHSQAT